MRRWAAFPLRLYVTAACVCLLAPILIVVILAFSGEGYLHFPPTSLSLQWFARFFGDLQWQHALLSSLVIGAIACLVSTTVGFFAAYAFLRAEFRGKKLLLSLMLTPIIVPSIITAIAMYYLAGRLGLIGNFLWLGLCHAVIAMPIVLLILLAPCTPSIRISSAPRSGSAAPACTSSAGSCCPSRCRASCRQRCLPFSPPSTSC
jgi:ABC-type spermidine/putrescine transport system permease subunit II